MNNSLYFHLIKVQTLHTTISAINIKTVNKVKPVPTISPCLSSDFNNHLSSPSCIASTHIGANKFNTDMIVSYVPNSAVVK